MNGNLEQRVARVFVSSTFMDMSCEREELVKYVFPELQRRLNERRASIVGVDLRWGVTAEQAQRGEVLSACIEEIDLSYPFFICLLGARYGWTPDKIEDRALSNYPWLKEFERKSVTEIEIQRGALSRQISGVNAFFYFRSDNASELVESDLSKKPGYTPEPGAAREKLDELKRSIRESPFVVREDYPDALTVGKWILEDIWNAVDRVFPRENAPSSRAKRRMEHEAFARARRKVYIGRREYFGRLDAHVAEPGQPLVIAGSSGSGKSALFANWAESFRQAHPDGFLFLHFVGGAPDSADHILLLRRIMEEIEERLSSSGTGANRGADNAGGLEIPTDPGKVIEAFPLWLARAEPLGRIVILIDALDQLTDRDNAHDLGWLPDRFPSHVRVVLSTLPGRTLKAVEERGWPSFPVEPMTREESVTFAGNYLSQYGKRLGAAQVDKIISRPQASNPLYLRTLLDELRIFGLFERLDERIEHYLQAQTNDALFDKVLERLEADYERDAPGLTKDFMSLIWASRQGLSETEALALLGTAQGPLPQAIWSPLHLALAESLVNRGGLLTFFHDYLRKAVEKRYLADAASVLAARKRIADYFGARPGDERKASELPWQLAKMERWEKLYEALSDAALFSILWNSDPHEAKSYWAELENERGLRALDAYRPVLDNPGEYTGHLWAVASLLADMGHRKEAAPLMSQIVEHFRVSGDWVNLAGAIGNQANLLYARGDLDGAMRLYEEAEAICARIGDGNGRQRALGNRALIMHTRGLLKDALALYKQKEAICRQLNNKDGLQRAIGAQAVILRDMGRADEAMALLVEQVRICRELGYLDELPRALVNQAILFKIRGDTAQAAAMLSEAWELSRQAADRDAEQQVLAAQADIAISQGRGDDALNLLGRAEAICRQIGSFEGLQYALGAKGVIFMDRGEPELALGAYLEKERICRQTGSNNELQKALGNLASIYASQGKLDEALVLHEEEERLCRSLDNDNDLAICLGNQAILLRRRGNPNKALALHHEEERVCRRIQNEGALQTCLANQANVLIDLGDLDAALRLLEESETLCRKTGDAQGLRRSLGSRAHILRSRGMNDEAMALLQEEERLCRSLNDEEELHVCLGAQGLIRQEQGEVEMALALYREKEGICRRHNIIDGLVIALANRATLLVNWKKAFGEAAPVAEEALELAQGHGMAALAKKIESLAAYARSKLNG